MYRNRLPLLDSPINEIYQKGEECFYLNTNLKDWFLEENAQNKFSYIVLKKSAYPFNHISCGLSISDEKINSRSLSTRNNTQ